MHPAAQTLIMLIEDGGTVAFAISGALAGMRRQLDLFGVLVLAVVTAVSGGIIRDVLLGSIPPDAIKSWDSIAIALGAGLLTLIFPSLMARLRYPMRVFDAAGLGIFAALGAQKALAFGINWPMAAALGMVTGIGGGMLRDMLSAEVPMVLRAEIYALAALLAASIAVGAQAVGIAPLPGLTLAASFGFGLRMLALFRNWSLPPRHPRT